MLNPYTRNVAVARPPVLAGGLIAAGSSALVPPAARRWRSMATAAVVLAVLIGAALGGIRLRQWMWIHTDAPYKSLRFDFDIENAHHWGSVIFAHANEKAVAAGQIGHGADWRFFLPAYVELYDQVVEEHPEGQYALDYSPARLLVAALWTRHERLVHPHVRDWLRPYGYNAPLLWLNTICEALAALGAFLLVRHWVWRQTLPIGRRNRRARFPMPRRAWILGLIAALLIWFNPAVLFDAHVFPQWEVWLLPSFFFAAWLASCDWWLLAGLVIPVGLMMKGQLAMVLPVFILWPLFEGKWGAALRFVVGFVIAAVALTWPWLIHNDYQWLQVSFIYPTHHWQQMAGDCDNLAAILSAFGWNIADPVFTLRSPGGHFAKVITIKTLLVSIYAICLVLCAWGAARKSRKNDPAFLIAISAPWLLMFALLVQMHERYLLWAAAVSAITIAINLGYALLHLLLTGIATSMIARALFVFGQNRPQAPAIVRALRGIHPGISWGVLVCAGIFLYGALAPRRRSI